EKLFLGIVHCGDLLGCVRVSGGLDGVNSKNLLPHSAGTGHFQNVIAVGCLDLIQPVLIVRVDLLHDCLPGLPGAGILAGEENTKAGANNHTDQTNHDNHQHGNPASGCNSCNQCLCRRNNSFHRCDGSLCCGFCSSYGSPGCCTGSLGSSSGGSGRSLGR